MVVAQGVVDVLEAVEVEQQDAHPRALSAGGGDRLLGAVVEEHAVGQVGEPVVQRLVLAEPGVAARPVDREQGHDEQRHEEQAVHRGGHHEWRVADEQGRGPGLEAEVLAQEDEHGRPLGKRRGRPREPVVERDEGGAGGGHADEVARGERRVAQAREVREPGEHERGRPERERALADVEGGRERLLARAQVGEHGGRGLGQRGRREPEGQEHGEHERRRGRDLVVVAREAHGEELADDDEGEEDPEQGGRVAQERDALGGGEGGEQRAPGSGDDREVRGEEGVALRGAHGWGAGRTIASPSPPSISRTCEGRQQRRRARPARRRRS